MILTVFRPKRIKNGKARVARSYRGRYRLEEEDNINDIPLYTTDKRVARERLEKIVREKQLESVGILPPQAIRTASQTPLDKHLADFVADLQAIGRDEQYIFDLQHRVARLITGMSLGAHQRRIFRFISSVESPAALGSQDTQRVSRIRPFASQLDGET